MRRLRTLMLLVALAAPALRAAEEHGEAGASREMLFRVVNFAILAGGLGYLIGKHGGPLMAARGAAIRRDLAEARRLQEQSEARARQIEQRLEGLDRQIGELRMEAKAEIAAEHARLDREAEQAVRKILALAEREMEAMARAARQELKSYAASLAVEMAEKKIATRIAPDTQRVLVGSFVSHLGR